MEFRPLENVEPQELTINAKVFTLKSFILNNTLNYAVNNTVKYTVNYTVNFTVNFSPKIHEYLCRKSAKCSLYKCGKLVLCGPQLRQGGVCVDYCHTGASTPTKAKVLMHTHTQGAADTQARWSIDTRVAID